MGYFFGFFLALGLAVCGSVLFFGRPTEGTMRISSIAERRYIPVAPMNSSGSIPFLYNCLFTVSCLRFSSFAIKAIVIKSFTNIEYRLYFRKCQQLFRYRDYLLNRSIVIVKEFFFYFPDIGIIYWTYYPDMGII